MPASAVREIAAILIDIHGQHEHQSLLSKRRHLEILDAYVGDADREKEGARRLTAATKAGGGRKNAGIDGAEREQEISFLGTRSVRSRRQDFGKSEDEELENEYRRFSNGQKIVNAVNGAYSNTGGESDCASEADRKGGARTLVISGYDEKLAELERVFGDRRAVKRFQPGTCRLCREYGLYDEETFYQVEKASR